MKKSGYHTMFHIYMIFFFSLFGTILLTICLCFLLITIQKTDGSTVRSDWPQEFTEEFREQIVFVNGKPQITQTGIELLQKDEIGLQLLDSSGQELIQYQKPKEASDYYSNTELSQLDHTGQLYNSNTTSFVETVSFQGKTYTYILHYPIQISKVTMYLNGEHFKGGKMVLMPIVVLLFFIILLVGLLYGLWMTKLMKQVSTAIQDIAERNYIVIQNCGVFADLYDSLNTLDREIQASDHMRAQTECLRSEWIANITHDLKTPLSPIKGYAELLQDGSINKDDIERYARVIVKNTAYLESLVDDLKLTYQLESGLLPVSLHQQDLIRFLKELVIMMLNTPEYENRVIYFNSSEETILYSFDQMLLTRAFRNLFINAFVHGDMYTEITLQIIRLNNTIQINIADNGPGMHTGELERLFERYYRGTHTDQKPEGSGLGLAITKGIVELHHGIISVSSIPGTGTTFQISLPIR